MEAELSRVRPRFFLSNHLDPDPHWIRIPLCTFSIRIRIKNTDPAKRIHRKFYKNFKRAFVNWKNGTLFKIAPFGIKLRDTILSDPPFFNNSAVVIKKLKFQGR